MENVIIKLNQIKKSFGSNIVLKGLDLDISKGEIFGLLGHNGAGKTTILRIILGLHRIDEGSVTVFNSNPYETQENARRLSGVLSEDNGLYESMTVYDNLLFFARAYNKHNSEVEKRMDELLDRFEILDKKHEVIKNFSLGMKKKVALVRTLFLNHKLILLDEPTNGLDPVSVNTLANILKEMSKEEGITFVLTTHNLDIVSRICDRVAIVKDGKNVYDRYLQDDNSDLTKTIIKCTNLNKDKVSTIMMDSYSNLKFEIDSEADEISLYTKNIEIISRVVKELVFTDAGVYEIDRDSFDLTRVYLDKDSE